MIFERISTEPSETTLWIFVERLMAARVIFDKATLGCPIHICFWGRAKQNTEGQIFLLHNFTITFFSKLATLQY